MLYSTEVQFIFSNYEVKICTKKACRDSLIISTFSKFKTSSNRDCVTWRKGNRVFVRVLKVFYLSRFVLKRFYYKCKITYLIISVVCVLSMWQQDIRLYFKRYISTFNRMRLHVIRKFHNLHEYKSNSCLIIIFPFFSKKYIKKYSNSTQVIKWKKNSSYYDECDKCFVNLLCDIP